MISVDTLDLGHFTRPATEWAGPHPRVEPVLGYLVRYPRGALLFDTGMGTGSAETDAHYRPVRKPLTVGPADVDTVVNCHLHFDHIGGNQRFPDTPVLVQRTELALARAGGHTIDSLLPGVRYVELDGEHEIAPGVRIVPTPGHTEGHQSLFLDHGDRVTVLAGQAYDFAHEFGTPYLPWLDRLAELAAGRPARVLFAHDHDLREGVLPAPR
ncbi:MBL fold metallo-hydrolase [Streptomyces sp. NPDC006553]|uniref:MBL fold metallo-hydrolase n=1 Tax=unclassified Streptomyces TaxID=2593676 RepID=UPI00224E88A9|nr:MBL fold metallo-hydrolase [Streptomyces sp. NBC_00233]MCX5225043.1 MBL fold metallo-hydrolase [Streptomyces sp. NBC_00233]